MSCGEGEYGTGDLRRRLSGTRICLDVVRAPEDFDGRISLDSIVLAEITLGRAVDLDQRDVLLFQRCCGLFVLGSESLAVATPRSKELGQHQIVLGDKFFKVVRLQIMDIAGVGEASEAKAERSQGGE